ncbi:MULTISPECIES: RipA family octameric membrane protein [unclassified Marinovum]|uniref:RipA family octameric membrane protein n=1 Tax=unclassified Marinovum TaxID=2647166 RepID=UPI003EDC9599
MESATTEHERTEEVLEIYKLLVEMADRVSQRRQSANSFYLTVNTAIIGATAYVSREAEGANTWAISLAGVAICILWIRAVLSYKSLNSAKFKVITELEGRLPVAAYKDEWEFLKGANGKRHTPFHKIEVLVPFVFIFVHSAQFAITLPWETIWEGVKSVFC